MRFKTLVLLVLLWPLQALALQVTDLYQVDEPVPPGEDSNRQQLLSSAFDSMIWRLSGLSDLQAYPQLQQLREDPQEVIRGYSSRSTILRVNFDPASLLSVLQQQELAIWGEQRPAILLWWTQQDGHGQHLYNSDQRMARLIVQRADYRGLPVRFPLADLEEQILTERLSLQEREQVDQLLQRYSADVLLRVNVDAAARPGASWQLYEQGRVRRGKNSAASVPALADAIFVELGEYFVQKYAVRHGEGQSLNIQVSALDFERLLQVEKVLAPFSGKLIKLDPEYGIWQVNAMPEQLRALFELQRIRQQPAPVIPQPVQPPPEPLQQPEAEPEPPATGLPDDGAELQQPEQLVPLHIDLYFR